MAIVQRAVLFAILIAITDVVTGNSQTGLYVNNGLYQTVLVDRLPSFQRREIMAELLELLGLHHKPRPVIDPRQNSVPRFMIELYRVIHGMGMNHDGLINQRWQRLSGSYMMRVNTEDNIHDADMIMGFVNHAASSSLRHYSNRWFFFNFEEVPPTETVLSAELRMYKQPVFGIEDKNPYTLEIFRLKEGSEENPRMWTREVNTTLSADQEGWLVYNVLESAQLWTYTKNSNYGIYIKVTDRHGRDTDPRDLGFVDISGSTERQSFLVVYFKTNQKLKPRKSPPKTRRRKRSAPVSKNRRSWEEKVVIEETYSIQSCQKRTLYVSFKELGWKDWIIAPEGYAAFYCQGDCIFPLAQKMNATNHAIVQTLVNLLNPFKVPRPCCTPTALSPISVLYFDDRSNVILKKYKDMVANSCGCR